MNTKFIAQIRNLQQNNIVILRERRSGADKRLLAQLTQGYTLIDLSLPIISSLAKRDAQCFVAQLQGNVYLANLQYAPQLLPILAEHVPFTKILASCTQSFALEKLAINLSNVRLVELPVVVDERSVNRLTKLVPFMLETDYLQNMLQREPVDVLITLWQGERSNYGGDYGEYLQRVLQSDIMFLTTVSDSEKFYIFMQAVAAQTGEVLNFSKLAQAASITPPTAKTWLNFLLGTGIVYLLEPVQNIGLKRLVSTKKLYFRDTGLCCYLLGLLNADHLMQSEYLEQLEQNYMLNKIRESYINEGNIADLHFYRDNNKKNIDVILRQGNVLYPLMLAHEELDVERVKFAFEVLEEYAEKNSCKLGDGAIIYPACVTKEVLPNLWQISAERL